MFLDLDGVLNSERYFARMMLGLSPEQKETFRIPPEDDIDPEPVTILNRILRLGAAKVVISSSWRYMHTVAEIDTALRTRGFVGEIIGATPDLVRQTSGRIFLAKERGHEVQAYLDALTVPPESFVILDDAEDMVHLSHRLVRTTWEGGLLDEHVEEAVRLLETPIAPAGSAP